MSNLALAERPLVESLPADLSRDFLAHHGLCPKAVADDGSLVVASTEGSLLDGADDIAFAYRLPFTIEPVSRSELEALIERLATRSERSVELARVDAGFNDAAGDALATDVRDLANQPPVIRYVNLLVRDAYDAAASDIHLEATRTGLSARFRLDGVLVPAPEPPSHLHHAVISRIKLLAELDIAERRRPQDGRIRVRLESRELDLRVSTVPTMYGESVVLRLLDHGGRPVTLDSLGMPADTWSAMSDLSARRARLGARHRSNRQRQDHDAIRGARSARRLDRKDHHGRRSHRVPGSGGHTDACAPSGGRHVSPRRCARFCARTPTS